MESITKTRIYVALCYLYAYAVAIKAHRTGRLGLANSITAFTYYKDSNRAQMQNKPPNHSRHSCAKMVTGKARWARVMQRMGQYKIKLRKNTIKIHFSREWDNDQMVMNLGKCVCGYFPNLVAFYGLSQINCLKLFLVKVLWVVPFSLPTRTSLLLNFWF